MSKIKIEIKGKIEESFLGRGYKATGSGSFSSTDKRHGESLGAAAPIYSSRLIELASSRHKEYR